MCGWHQANDDDFNWMPNKGPTQTRTTGPSRDHTLGSNGDIKDTENHKIKSPILYRYTWRPVSLH